MSSKIRLTRICQYCAAEFEAKTTVTKYCSLKCAQRAYKQKSKEEKINESNKATQEIRDKPIQNIKAKEFLSITETCKLLGVSRFTFYRMVKRRQVITQNIGRRVIIRRIDIDNFFNPPNARK